MKRQTVRHVAATLGAALVLGVAGALGYIYSGLYDISARRPHFGITQWALTTVQERSVRRHAAGIEAPPLDEPALVQRGLVLYRDRCVVCHAAPGVGRGPVGTGLNPDPPPLVEVADDWSDAELYWIIANGLKMAGMPSFGIGEDRRDLWALTAWVRRMGEISPAQYARMVAAIDGRVAMHEAEWVAATDPGWTRLRAEGDADRGRSLLAAYGCGSCHTIPGLPGARSKVGPPLDRFGVRQYIAGQLVNTPARLVRWIADPQAIEPGTVMPDLGVSDAEALHMAAYLYTLD
jgi:mono/diheme cytochrome c family protein